MHLFIELDHGAGKGMYLGWRPPHRMLLQLTMQDRLQVGPIDRLHLLTPRVPAISQSSVSQQTKQALFHTPHRLPACAPVISQSASTTRHILFHPFCTVMQRTPFIHGLHSGNDSHQGSYHINQSPIRVGHEPCYFLD